MVRVMELDDWQLSLRVSGFSDCFSLLKEVRRKTKLGSMSLRYSPSNSPLAKDNKITPAVDRLQHILSTNKRHLEVVSSEITSPPYKVSKVLEQAKPNISLPGSFISISGYNYYSKRSAEACAAKQHVDALFGPEMYPKDTGKAKQQWPSCSMPSASTSGYTGFNTRSTEDMTKSAKSSIRSCFGADQIALPLKSESQSQPPSCSMPSASTSGYTSYNHRNTDTDTTYTTSMSMLMFA